MATMPKISVEQKVELLRNYSVDELRERMVVWQRSGYVISSVTAVTPPDEDNYASWLLLLTKLDEPKPEEEPTKQTSLIKIVQISIDTPPIFTYCKGQIFEAVRDGLHWIVMSPYTKFHMHYIHVNDATIVGDGETSYKPVTVRYYDSVGWDIVEERDGN